MGARGITGSESQVTSVVEPRKVGLAMSTGRFELEKVVVTPDDTSFPLPTSYPFDVACTSAGEDVPLRDENGASVSRLQLTPGQVVTYNGGGTSAWGQVNVPRYAECTLTEVGAPGATVTFDPEGAGGTSGPVTALRDYASRNDIANAAYPTPIDLERVTATNTYSLAGFTVSKEVDNGGAVDQDGTPISYDESYDFSASCLFNGTEMIPAADRTFALDEGDTESFDDLPAGATCTVTETDAGTAAGTTHVVTEDSSTGGSIDGTTATFTLGADVEGDHVNAVDYTNHYTVGSMDVTKEVIGPGADPWAGNTFRILVTCELDNADPTTVFEDERYLGEEEPVWTIDNLPTGATCEVIEDPENDGGASFTVLVPDDGRVTIGDSTTESVSIANVFGLGAISVTKQVEGDVDEVPEALTGRYAVSLSCTLLVNGELVPITIPGGPERVLDGDGGTAAYDGLPVRARCLVEETGSDPVPQQVTVTPDDGAVVVGPEEEGPVAVVVTNTYQLGSLRVSKTVSGPGAVYGTGPFEVTLACDVTDGDETTSVPIPGGAVRELSADNELTTQYDQLPVGAECSVRETGSSGSQSTSITVATDGGEPVVTEGDEATVAVVDDTASSGTGEPGVVVGIDNRFEVGGVKVVKRVTGPGADKYGQGPFEVTLTCTSDLTGSDVDVDVDIPGGSVRTLTRASGLRTAYRDLPVGAQCTLAETDSGDADETSISLATGGAPATVTPGGSVDLVIGDDTGTGTGAPGVVARVTNRFDSDPPVDPPPVAPPGFGGNYDNPPAGTSPSSGGDLPDTGSDVPPWLPWLGLLGVLAGLVLTVVGRRRKA